MGVADEGGNGCARPGPVGAWLAAFVAGRARGRASEVRTPAKGFARTDRFAAHPPPHVTPLPHLPAPRPLRSPLRAHITPPTPPETPQPIVPPPPPPGPDVVPPDIDDPLPGETPPVPVHEPPGVPPPMAMRRRPFH